MTEEPTPYDPGELDVNSTRRRVDLAKLTEQERIREIASLLVTGALRLHKKFSIAAVPVPPKRPALALWDTLDDDVEKQIVRYLVRNVLASPKEIERALNIPHVTLARRLNRLRMAGLIHVSGRTRGAQYSVVGHHGEN